MERRKKRIMLVSALMIAVVIMLIIFLVKQYFTPSTEVRKLTDYYPVQGNEMVLMMQNKVYDEKAQLIDGKVYVSTSTVADDLNKRFYWDSNEKILIYTTPTAILKTGVESSEYTENGTTKKVDYPIVKEVNDTAYIALDYVKAYSNVSYTTYTNPNRVVIQNDFKNAYEYVKVTEDTQVRTKAGIKNPILKQVKKGTKLIIANGDVKKEGFRKVMTADGVVGYVKISYIGKPFRETLTSDYQEPQYTSIGMNKKVNLVWHQVTNQVANNVVGARLDAATGVNVISPTWFSVTTNQGDISSLASSNYVAQAHARNVKVWGLVDDFKKEVNKEELLSHTTSRENLENNLIRAAKQYSLDGINIDFENITQKAADHYIQFIREMSVKCRNNKLVLSIDNYTPTAYTAHYDRQEQGLVADYIITMAYDEHYAGSSESGSVSSIGFVKDAIANTLKYVPKEKVIIALPFYTRLWMEKGSGDDLQIQSKAYGFTDAKNLMKEKGVELNWNAEIGQYYGQYTENNLLCRMWLEDEKSYDLKVQSVAAADVAGVANWKLGFESDKVWSIIQKYIK